MKTGTKLSILGFAGSLRKGSYNKSILRTAVEVAPENVVIEVFDLEGMPSLTRISSGSRWRS
jgi:chromate reductase, NAD(P)H dehydrogenase (quinone)